jgi:nucleotide-binding universal stress UspA family protein
MIFRKILCPIDFSPGSRRAMQAAIRLANESGAELVLVHAWHLPPILYLEHLVPGDAIQQMSDDATRMLDAALAEARDLVTARVTAKLLTGVPWMSIVEATEDPAIDLVVIGTHGRTGLSRVLVGSVAEKVIRHAPCSVMAIRPDSEVAPFEHVLCPSDFTDPARYATALAASFVRRGGARIALLHVYEPPVTYANEPFAPAVTLELDRRAAAQLQQTTAELRREVDVAVEPRLRVGSAGAEILHALDEDRTIDLVVMGSHGRTGIKRVLLGSVAEKVVRHARCPVVVARERAGTR